MKKLTHTRDTNFYYIKLFNQRIYNFSTENTEIQSQQVKPGQKTTTI